MSFCSPGNQWVDEKQRNVIIPSTRLGGRADEPPFPPSNDRTTLPNLAERQKRSTGSLAHLLGLDHAEVRIPQVGYFANTFRRWGRRQPSTLSERPEEDVGHATAEQANGAFDIGHPCKFLCTDAKVKCQHNNQQ